jgi:DNA-directed RNA polymerase specialized sigma24 family protein
VKVDAVKGYLHRGRTTLQAELDQSLDPAFA